MAETEDQSLLRLPCARCGTEVWWWKAYWHRGQPDVPYCSRTCAIPGYSGEQPDGSRSPEGQVGQEDTALRRGGGSQPAPPGLIDGEAGG